VSLPPGKARLIKHRFLAPQERVYLETHPSRWFYFADFAPFVIVVLLFYYVVASSFFSFLPAVPVATHLLVRPSGVSSLAWEYALGFTVFVLFLVAVGGWSVRARRWSEFTYAVTDTRVIQQRRAKGRGLDIQEIPLRQVRDVEVIRTSRYGHGIGTLRLRSLSYMAATNDEIVDGFKIEHPADGRAGAAGLPTRVDVIDPREPWAQQQQGAGVEWWIGVPNAIEIERLIASETRAVFHDDTPTPVVPTPSD